MKPELEPLINKDDNASILLDNIFREVLKPSKVILTMIKARLEIYSVELTDRQKEKLIEEIDKESDGPFTLTLSEEQQSKLTNQGVDIVKLLDFSDAARNLESDVQTVFDDIALQTVSQFSADLAKAWQDQVLQHVDVIDKNNKNFNDLLLAHIGESVNLLKAVTDICTTIGSNFNDLFRGNAAKTNDVVFEVLSHSHGRSCQIAQEIITLVSNGFADGAHGRWRSLHEITTVACFVSQNDELLAKKYLEHENITKYKRALQYQKHYKALNFAPISDEDIDILKNRNDKLVKEYGPEFKSIYGWASSHVGNKNPNFAQIEELTEYDHMRPFYQLANINIHAGSESLFYRLGANPNETIKSL